MTEIPAAFIKACGGLHQDIGLLVETPEQMADAAIELLNDSERLVLRSFLQELLTNRTEGASLRNVWRAGGSDIYFPKAEDLLNFLRLMLHRLG